MNPPGQSLEKQELVAAGDCAEESLKPKPTILKRFMDKVGLDASALLIMFKSDLNPSSFDFSETSYANVFLFSVEAPSLLQSPCPCTNRQ